MKITVTQWAKWQQTEGKWKLAGWFKVHRGMRGNPDWRRLSGDAKGLLFDVLMSTDHGTGIVDMALDDLAYTCGLEIEELDALLAELVRRDWITVDSSRAGAHAGGRADGRATRGEKSKSNTRERAPTPNGGSAPATYKLAPAARAKGDKFGPDLGPQRITFDEWYAAGGYAAEIDLDGEEPN